MTSLRSEEPWQEKFLLSSCELSVSPEQWRLDSVSEHVSAGRMSCEQNKEGRVSLVVWEGREFICLK